MTEGEALYPSLAYLIGCWFHQDFDIAGDTLEAVIESHKRLEPPADRAKLRADIARLLERYDGDELRAAFVRLFRPDIDPEPWGMSTRQWLLRIAELLR